MRGLLNHSWLIAPAQQAKGICEQLYTYRSPSYEKVMEKHREEHPIALPDCLLCNWDGRIRLYFQKGDKVYVPTSLFLSNPFDLDYVDLRVWEEPKLVTVPSLRDYQREAAEVLLIAKRGILGSPTGSGKTHIMAGVLSALPRPALIICHTTRLMTQLREMLERLLTPEKVGLLGGGYDERQEITVGMIQTLWRRRRELSPYLKSVRVVVVDECHHAAAKTYFWVIQTCEGAGYRFGFSATPFRSVEEEELWMRAAIGDVVWTIDRGQLEEGGFLSKALCIFIRFPNPERFDGDWSDYYFKSIVRCGRRNSLILSILSALRQEGRLPALVFVWAVEHGHLLRSLASAAGFKVEFVYGAINVDEREQLQRALDSGELDVLIATDVFKEGIDLPNVKVLLNAGGFKSKVTTLQKCGRVLRPHGGQPAIIIDIYDVGSLLTKHSRQRLNTLVKEFGEGCAHVIPPAQLPKLLKSLGSGKEVKRDAEGEV